MQLGQWQWVVGRRIIRKRWLREKSRSFTRRDVKDHFVWHDQLLLSKTSGHLRLMEYFFFVKMLRGLTDIFFFSHTTAFQTSRTYSQVIFGQNIITNLRGRNNWFFCAKLTNIYKVVHKILWLLVYCFVSKTWSWLHQICILSRIVEFLIVCRYNHNHIQVLNEQRKNSKTGKIEDEPLLDWENYYNLVSHNHHNYLT